jgi:hypothetical protein
MPGPEPSTPRRVALGPTSIVGRVAQGDKNVVIDDGTGGAFRLVRVMLEEVHDAVAIRQVFRMLEDGGPLARPRKGE